MMGHVALIAAIWFGEVDIPHPPTDIAPVEVEAQPQHVPSPWDRLAECETHGQWDYGKRSPEPWGSNIYHGGLQFLPSTWDWIAPMVGLGHIEYAYEATPEQQVKAGMKLQELQGWGAWPACSRKLGLR